MTQTVLPLPDSGPASYAGRPALPMVRGECESGPRPCPHVLCRHHVPAGLSRLRPESRAVTAYRDWLESGLSTCLLDLLTDEEGRPVAHGDDVVAIVSGIDRRRVPQVAAEGVHRLSLYLRGERRDHGHRRRRPWDADSAAASRRLLGQGMAPAAVAARLGVPVRRVEALASGEPLLERCFPRPS